MDRSPWPIVQTLLAEQRFAVLATQGGDAPYTSLVAFAVTTDLRCVMFPTRAGTRKFTNLETNPQVALLVDNRSNSAEDYRNATALTIIGKVGLGRGPEEDQRRELLLARHPSLADFLAEPDCRIAVVNVTEYRLVTQFESVVRLDPAAR
jgi:hypothetical protein